MTRSVPPYCVVAGNPARPVKSRGNVEAILTHEDKLYAPEARLSRQAIETAATQIERARRAGS